MCTRDEQSYSIEVLFFMFLFRANIPATIYDTADHCDNDDENAHDDDDVVPGECLEDITNNNNVSYPECTANTQNHSIHIFISRAIN